MRSALCVLTLQSRNHYSGGSGGTAKTLVIKEEIDTDILIVFFTLPYTLSHSLSLFVSLSKCNTHPYVANTLEISVLRNSTISQIHLSESIHYTLKGCELFARRCDVIISLK